MPSSMDPLNAIDPKYLSLGSKLNDEFQPGQTSLDGVPLPYAGWVEQMKRAARRRWRRRCGRTRSTATACRACNEAHGKSHLQLAAGEAREALLERHLRAGVVHAVATDGERVEQHAARRRHVERPARASSRRSSRDRNDVDLARATRRTSCRRHSCTSCRSARARNTRNSGGVVERARRRLAGEHDLQVLSRACRCTSGRASATCPAQFRAGCIPAIIDAGAVFAQDKGSFDPAKGPLFNKDAFEPVDAFNYYYGQGQPGRGDRPRASATRTRTSRS